MNIKQFLTLSSTIAFATAGLSATVATEMRVEEIATALITNKLKIDDSVIYKGTQYTINSIDISKNINSNNYSRIYFRLKRPIELLNITWGEEIVNVDIIKGQQPVYPYEKVENPDAVNDTKDYVSVHMYTYYYEKLQKLQDIAKASLLGASVGAATVVGAKLGMDCIPSLYRISN